MGLSFSRAPGEVKRATVFPRCAEGVGGDDADGESQARQWTITSPSFAWLKARGLRVKKKDSRITAHPATESMW
jgi:hypothetical protein